MKLPQILLLFVFQLTFGQNIPAILVGKTPLEAERYIGTDDYGNIYFIENTIFYKIGKDKTYQFSDLQLGKLSSADIINPLKITLFYEDMNTVVFLDRHLIDINRVRFNMLPKFRTVGSATTASNNNLWILNVDTRSLEIYNYFKNEVIARSQPVSSKVVAQDSNFNFCWLLLENSLECYNAYGALVSRIPAISFTSFSEDNGRLVGQTKDGLVFLDKNSFEFVPLDLPTIGVQQFFLNDEKLYLYDGEFIYTFQLDLTN